MKNLRHCFLLVAVVASAFLASCGKDRDEPKPEPPVTAPPTRQGIYILSEGLFNRNNTVLSYFNYDTRDLVRDQFSVANGRGIGDTGNDAKVYGSKMYIVVNVSGTVEVVNAKTAKSIKTVDFKNGTVNRQPRYVVFNKNKAFISSYDGTVAVLDTATLNVEKYITVGRNPEQMAVANNKLYVANSGGLDYPNYDKTVSVIDLNTLTETRKITVGDNARGVAADADGDVYVLSTGNYGTIRPSMAIIDSRTDQVKQSFENFSGGSMVISGDYAYITAGAGSVKLFNVKAERMERDNFITDGTRVTVAYGVAVDELSGEVFVTDAKNYSTNGEVVCYGKDGVRKYALTTGINPNGVVFINK